MYDNIKQQTAFPLSRSVYVMGGVGSVIGAASAAATNVVMVKNDEIDKSEAVKNVLKESVGAGLAAAAATVVIGAAAPRSSFLSIVGFAVVATGAKILWDKAASPVKQALPETKSKDKNEEKKSLPGKK